MSNVRVTYDDVNNVANQLAKAKSDLEQQLSQLLSQVQQLTESGFITDQAAPKFRQSYEEWTKGTRSAIDGLDGMSNFLKQAVQVYQQADSQLSQSL
jgi:WXG100 family type VII secretion target